MENELEKAVDEIKQAYEKAVVNVDKYEKLMTSCKTEEKIGYEMSWRISKEQLHTLRWVLNLLGK